MFLVLCMRLCVGMCIWVQQLPVEARGAGGVRSPRSRSYRQLLAAFCGCWEWNVVLMQIQCTLLTAEPFLYPSDLIFVLLWLSSLVDFIYTCILTYICLRVYIHICITHTLDYVYVFIHACMNYTKILYIYIYIYIHTTFVLFHICIIILWVCMCMYNFKSKYLNSLVFIT